MGCGSDEKVPVSVQASVPCAICGAGRGGQTYSEVVIPEERRMGGEKERSRGGE